MIETTFRNPRAACTRWCGLAGLTVLLVVLSGCQASRSAGTTPTRWDEARLSATLQVADEHMAAGRFERARQTLGAFSNSSAPRLHLTLARADVEEGKYAAALQRLDAIASAGASVPAYHHLRAVALEGLGRWDAAAGAYERAYQFEPTVDRLTAWVDALVLAGQAEAALPILDRERSRFPGRPGVQLLAARLWERKGNLTEATRELATAALAEPDSPEIRRRLAEAYTSAGRYADALTAWRSLVDKAQDGEARYRYRRRLADCLLRAGQYDEARRAYRVQVLTRPEDDEARLGLAAACLAAGEPAEALAASMKLLEQRHDSAEARLVAALACRRLNQPGRAREYLSDAGRGGEAGGAVRELLARWE